jgi:hypothetical protein
MKSEHSNPVFLVGFFRSGTSLLHSLLNQHPQVSLMYECDVWDFPAPLADWRFRRNWLERQEFYCRALSRHRLTLAGSLRGLEAIRTPVDLYRTVGEGKQAALWGEKSPVYGPRLRQIARACPEASFILLWRDPVEIHRSVLHAACSERFFQRPGMVSRLIYHQEQMIRQAVELTQAGARIHHVTYSELVDHTPEVCEKLCRFLNIEFDKAMLDLGHADFSAVFSGPHHDHLRRGVIERQPLSDAIVDPSTAAKLRRFGTRWNRLLSERFGLRRKESGGGEPGLMERAFHRLTGTLLYWGHNLKRVMFEVLPLPWLRAYRLTKACFLSADVRGGSKRLPLLAQLRAQWVTVLASGLVLLGVALIDFFTGPDLTMAPLYMIPCALLTLAIDRRCGSLGAVAGAVVWSVLQHPDSSPARLDHVFAWNSLMRFLLLQAIVLLLDRLSIETSAESEGRA